MDKEKILNELIDIYMGNLISVKCIELHLTDLCNHNCIWCVSKGIRRNRESFTYIQAKSLIDEIHRCGGQKIIFSGGGEPLLFDRIDDLLKQSKKLGIENVLITNGGYLSVKNIKTIAECCSVVRVSLDAADKVSHTKIHRPKDIERDNFNIIKGNTKILVQEMQKHGGDVIGTFVITEDNKSEVNAMIELCVDLKLRKIQLKTENSLSVDVRRKIVNSIIPVIKNNKSREVEIGLDSIKERLIHNRFDWYLIYMNAVIEANGDMYPCCHTSAVHDWYYGNVRDKGFTEVWYGDRRKLIIDYARREGLECKACSELSANNTVSKVINKYIKKAHVK